MHVKDVLLIESRDMLDTMNLHFIVHRGGTLVIRAPALQIARYEVRCVLHTVLKKDYTSVSSVPHPNPNRVHEKKRGRVLLKKTPSQDENEKQTRTLKWLDEF